MLRLQRAISRSSGHAPVIPGMYPTLINEGINIRSGEVSMIAGEPGSGKSTLALSLAYRAQTPTLYVSADTHSHTVALRLLAMLSKQDQNTVEPYMETHPEWVRDTLKLSDHIRWCFDSAPTMRSIEEEIKAHEELFGDSPELVIIDNLTDIAGGEGDEWGAARSLLKDMKFLAREHECAIVILHHTSEGFQVGEGQCPPKRAIQGKLSQTPALVLTIAQATGSLMVCPVKNRYGQSNPSGFPVSYLGYMPASMQVFDYAERDR